MPSAIHLPTDCKLTDLASVLAKSEALNDGEPVKFVLPQGTFLSLGVIAFLCAYGIRLKSEGRTVSFYCRHDAGSYLSRMGLFDYLQLDDQVKIEGRSEIGRFLPLRLPSISPTCRLRTSLVAKPRVSVVGLRGLGGGGGEV